MDEQRQDDQLEPIYNSSVPIQDVTLKTYRKRWTIERGGERGSGISVLMARHDDDDDDMKLITRRLYCTRWGNLSVLTNINPSFLIIKINLLSHSLRSFWPSRRIISPLLSISTDQCFFSFSVLLLIRVGRDNCKLFRCQRLMSASTSNELN